jgi:hypothetical protein
LLLRARHSRSQAARTDLGVARRERRQRRSQRQSPSCS